MSSGSAAIPLLKAAPEADQVADRLSGGRWRGLELCLAPRHVATAEALDAAIAVGRGVARRRPRPDRGVPRGLAERRVRARRPARRRGQARHRGVRALRGRDRRARADDPPVRPDDARGRTATTARSTRRPSRSTCASTPQACAAEGVTPLIENVPPVLRMRTGGVYLTPVGGHWRDLQAWCGRIEGLRATFDTSHAALFEHFAAAYPSLFGLAGADELSLERCVEELGELTDVAHVSDAHGLLGEGLPVRHRRAGPRPRRAPARRDRALHRRGDQRARPGAARRT